MHCRRVTAPAKNTSAPTLSGTPPKFSGKQQKPEGKYMVRWSWKFTLKKKKKTIIMNRKLPHIFSKQEDCWVGRIWIFSRTPGKLQSKNPQPEQSCSDHCCKVRSLLQTHPKPTFPMAVKPPKFPAPT